jgi:hypothetical protein
VTFIPKGVPETTTLIFDHNLVIMRIIPDVTIGKPITIRGENIKHLPISYYANEIYTLLAGSRYSHH